MIDQNEETDDLIDGEGGDFYTNAMAKCEEFQTENARLKAELDELKRAWQWTYDNLRPVRQHPNKKAWRRPDLPQHVYTVHGDILPDGMICETETLAEEIDPNGAVVKAYRQRKGGDDEQDGN